MNVFGKWKGRSLADFDLKKLKRHFLPYSVLLAALFAMTFFGVCVPDFGPRGPRGPAAQIQDKTISFREFRWYYTSLLENRRQQLGEDFDPENHQVAQETISEMITAYVSYFIARDFGFHISESSVEQYVREQTYFHNQEGKYDNEIVRRTIDYWGITADIYKDSVVRELTLQKMQNLASEAFFLPAAIDTWKDVAASSAFELEYLEIDPAKVTVDIADAEVARELEDALFVEELRQDYQSHIHLYQQPAARKARQILIAYQGARSALEVTRSKSQAQELARQLYEDVKERPADFRKLASEYSDDLASKDSGGDMGFLRAEDVVPEISEVVFSMKSGEWAPMISSPFGFHILQLTEVQEPVDISFDSVKETLARKRLMDRQSGALARDVAIEVLASLTSSAAAESEPPRSFEELMNKHHLDWQIAPKTSFSSVSIEGELASVEGLVATVLQNLSEEENPKDATGKVVPTLHSGEDSKLYIVKIKDISISKPKVGDAQAQDDAGSAVTMFESLARLEAYYRFQSLVSYYRDQWQKEQKIRINKDYLSLGRSPM